MAGFSLRALLRRRLAVLRSRWPEAPGLLTPRFPLGAGALIRDAEGRVLLIHQTYQRPPLWLPPGGWVDRGELPRQAAARELREELSAEVAVGRPLAIGGGGYGEVTVLFEGRLLSVAPFQLSDETEQADYFHPEALPPMAEAARRCLLEALAALDAPA